jgi:hypothetical protein
MANRSPFLGQALGEAGLAGLSAYQGTRREQVKEKLEQDKAQRQIAKIKREEARQDQLDKMSAAKFQFETAKPHVISEDEKKYGIYNPKTGNFDPIQGGNPLLAQPGTEPENRPFPHTGQVPTQGGIIRTQYDQAVAALPPGLRGPDMMRDEQFLQSIPDPRERSIVQGLADYRISPNTLSSKGGHRERLIGAAARYDPSYDMTMYPAKQRSMNGFYSGGAQSPAGIMLNGNTALQHLGDMSDALEEMKSQPGILNSIGRQGIPFISYLANQANAASIRGTPAEAALQKFMTSRQKYVEEVTKFYAGGQGTEAERQLSLGIIDPNLSLEGLRATVAQDTRLMAAKVSALQHSLMQGMGPSAWRSALIADPNSVLVYREGQEALKRIEARERAANTPEARAGQATGVNPSRIRHQGKTFVVNPATGRFEAVPQAAGGP